MQPKELTFTDQESQQLGEYLDQFVAAGPLEALPEELFKQVQVLVARKIWEIRPDIARAIQAVADEDQPPALLIKNVPIDDPLPDTPRDIRPKTDLTELRSHYFHAGVSAIRYGDLISMDKVHLINIVREKGDTNHEIFPGRAMHRDINGPHFGDFGLHTQRENTQAETPIISIDDIPSTLRKELESISFEGEPTFLIQQTNEGKRFHPCFKEAPRSGLQGMYDDGSPTISTDDMPAVQAFFDWMKNKALQEDHLVLREKDFLLIDQSRTFHGGTPYYVHYPVTEGRWLTRMQCEVLDGSRYALGDEQKKGMGKLPEDPVERKQVLDTFYPMPGDIDELEVLKQLSEHSNHKQMVR